MLWGFDIETSQLIPHGNVWRPGDLGVACASMAAEDGTILLFPARGTEYEPRLAPDAVHEMIASQRELQLRGDRIVSFNGLGFDYRVLYENAPQSPGVLDLFRAVTLNHYDIMFQFFCEKGWAVGLGAILNGIEIKSSKGGIIGGYDAPAMWTGDGDSKHVIELLERTHTTPGSQEARDLVLDYVENDSRATLEVAQFAQERGHLAYVSKAARRWSWPLMGKRLLTVSEALALPEPAKEDLAWLKDPWSRDKFDGWLQERH
jgi:hypothetical protein